MEKYRFFNERLTDAKIADLSDSELEVLIQEAGEEHLRLEREIENLIWQGEPHLDSEGHPIHGVWPSEYSYLPIFYHERITQDPLLRERLIAADELSQRIGHVLAIKGSAVVVRTARITQREAIERGEGIDN